MFPLKRHPSRNELRKFGWAMLAGFGVIGAVLWVLPWWRGSAAGLLAWTGGGGARAVAVSLWLLGLVLLGVSLGLPRVARPIYVVWMAAGAGIGLIVSTILLTILFFLLLPIFSLLVRWGDPLRRRLLPHGTYWEDYRGHEASLERMKRPF